ncbi:MAG: hypothetical protein RBU21_23980, partial [FCB group bacterium]|nr:hypothetical protein [FCB group bacterium]
MAGAIVCCGADFMPAWGEVLPPQITIDVSGMTPVGEHIYAVAQPKAGEPDVEVIFTGHVELPEPGPDEKCYCYYNIVDGQLRYEVPLEYGEVWSVWEYDLWGLSYYGWYQYHMNDDVVWSVTSNTPPYSYYIRMESARQPIMCSVGSYNSDVLANYQSSAWTTCDVVQVVLEQHELATGQHMTKAEVNLTWRSYAGGVSNRFVWTNSPAGLSNVVLQLEDRLFTFNPSNSTPGEYIVKAWSEALPSCCDTCRVSVLSVDLDWETLDSALDDNPNWNGGKRIFPDKQSPTDSTARDK